MGIRRAAAGQRFPRDRLARARQLRPRAGTERTSAKIESPKRPCELRKMRKYNRSANARRRPRVTNWERWIWQPQTKWLRRAIFQVHMWSAIGLGLYVFM